MSSELAKMAQSGVLSKLRALNVLDPGNGILIPSADVKYTGALKDFYSYSFGSYNDAYGKRRLEKLIGGDSVQVIKTNRVQGEVNIELLMQSKLYSKQLEIVFPIKV